MTAGEQFQYSGAGQGLRTVGMDGGFSLVGACCKTGTIAGELHDFAGYRCAPTIRDCVLKPQAGSNR